MAERQLFHVRKALNTLYRSALVPHHARQYASSTSTATPDDTEPIDTTFAVPPQHLRTHNERLLYLRAMDQKLLRDTSDQCDTLISHIRSSTSTLSSLPTTIPSRKNDPVTYPTYTISSTRSHVASISAAADAVIAATELVKSHLEDLRKEDVYAHQSTSVSGEWEREISGWTLEERERELEAMKIQEVAEMTRMRSTVEGFARRMREAEVKGESSRGMGAGVGEGEKVENPFGARERGRGKEKEVIGKREKGWGQGHVGNDGKEVKVKSESPSAAREKEKASAKEGKEKKAKEDKEVEAEKKTTTTTSLAERMARMWGKA